MPYLSCWSSLKSNSYIIHCLATYFTNQADSTSGTFTVIFHVTWFDLALLSKRNSPLICLSSDIQIFVPSHQAERQTERSRLYETKKIFFFKIRLKKPARYLQDSNNNGIANSDVQVHVSIIRSSSQNGKKTFRSNNHSDRPLKLTTPWYCKNLLSRYQTLRKEERKKLMSWSFQTKS